MSEYVSGINEFVMEYCVDVVFCEDENNLFGIFRKLIEEKKVVLFEFLI